MFILHALEMHTETLFCKTQKEEKIKGISFYFCQGIVSVLFVLISILYAEDNATDLASVVPGPHCGISSRGEKLMLFHLPTLFQLPWSQWLRSERSLTQVKDRVHSHRRKLTGPYRGHAFIHWQIFIEEQLSACSRCRDRVVSKRDKALPFTEISSLVSKSKTWPPLCSSATKIQPWYSLFLKN